MTRSYSVISKRKVLHGNDKFFMAVFTENVRKI